MIKFKENEIKSNDKTLKKLYNFANTKKGAKMQENIIKLKKNLKE